MSDASPAGPLTDRPFVQVGLTVRDLPRAVGFYRDVLGLTFLFETNGMAFFDVAGTRLMLGLHPDTTAAIGGSILYFDDPDLDRTGPKLEAAGVRFRGPAEVVQSTPTHELKLRAFSDPDGNVLALMGMVAKGRGS